MRIAIMGAGGLGGFYGAMLAQAGEEVAFIARGEHLRAMQRDGLHVDSVSAGEFHLARLEATDDPASLAPVDAVLLGVKAYDLEQASEAMLPLLGPATFVLPLLNGVDMADRIGAVIGPERVLGGVVFGSSNVIAPGRVRHVLDAPLLFGELAGGRSERGDALERVLQAAKVNALQSEEIRRELWHKFIFVSPLAGVSSVTRLATRAMIGRPETRALFEQTMREVAAVARASGCEVPEELLARHLALAERVDPRHTVSMLIDLRNGRRLELDAMLGAVLRLGERLGVPTPSYRVLYAALKPYENGAPE